MSQSNQYKRYPSNEQFVRIWKDCAGDTNKVSEITGLKLRAVFNRRRSCEKELGIVLSAQKSSIEAVVRHHKARVNLNINDDNLPLASDPHVWPGDRTTVQRAYIEFVKRLKPKHIILMGDVFDGARLSRHPRIGFMESRPTVWKELEAVTEFLTEIENAAPKGAVLIWCLGNHDARYEAYLAANAPEMEGVSGMHLKDRFPKWLPCWSVHINENTPNHTVIKHRWHNGIHAHYNNVLKGGVNIVTAHLHKLDCRKYTDYRGNRYGVDAGFMADVGDPQFTNYLEDGCVDWASGFPVITFKNGKMMRPEFVQKWDEDMVEFRGEVIKV